jgi:t-SNARE complex subunit (syntaxin)
MVISLCWTAEADEARHTNDALADATNHTTRDQDVFCHCVVVVLVVHVEVVVV